MPKNIEVKARLADVAAAEETARRLSGAAPQVIQQVDTFFACRRARLKLRVLGPDSGELIWYDRSDQAGARASQYLIARTPDPQSLREILSATLGTMGTVKKTRRLFLVGQTRIHIDAVEGLGEFLELEVVLQPDQPDVEGHAIVQRLLSEFDIEADSVVAGAYVDLLGMKGSREAKKAGRSVASG